MNGPDNASDPPGKRAAPKGLVRRPAGPPGDLNRQSHKGLTLEGMSAMIAGAIGVYRMGAGTRNDCIVVVSRLVRLYHKKLLELRTLPLPATSLARLALTRGEPVHQEHAIPVNCITNLLIDTVIEDQPGPAWGQAAAEVRSIIESSCHIAHVTKDEHLDLNPLRHSMPDGHHEYPWRNIWARYTACGVELPT